VREVVRPWYGRVLTIFIAAICLAVTTAVVFQDGWADAATVAPWTGLVAVACWATFWRPCVAVSDAGVQIVNVSRTIDVPWPALEDLDTNWALTLVTAFGRFTAWSAPAPGARHAMQSTVSERAARRRPDPVAAVRPGDLADTPSGSAAVVVRERWERLRRAGHLDDPRLERERAEVHWHVGTAATAVALIVVGVIVNM